ncbi:YecA family protein [Idiomarina tyrosinivorans]|uniref:YecA family protein n=1 Tax=Idiomarina tyrosinivorans TaxID=1445662 RepID=A0A432ZSI5_9GAMM|nr:UPF0149 family protein [Idiomarina tyrosinivorans]RUO80801.1 YecA family protein [Idiomarina tyrosinivorans]
MASNSQQYNYDRLSEQLQQHDVHPSAADIHGMLTGLLASGTPLTDDDWLVLMSDLANEGQAFDSALLPLLRNLAEDTSAGLRDREFGFQLLLPEEKAPLHERLQALVAWVQSFLVGFGINQTNLTALSKDLREAIDDMVEIAKLEFEAEDSEEAEQAYDEVLEYLRVSAMMCAAELAQTPRKPAASGKTLH